MQAYLTYIMAFCHFRLLGGQYISHFSSPLKIAKVRLPVKMYILEIRDDTKHETLVSLKFCSQKKTWALQIYRTDNFVVSGHLCLQMTQ